jgi:hypothetical protein
MGTAAGGCPRSYFYFQEENTMKKILAALLAALFLVSASAIAEPFRVGLECNSRLSTGRSRAR